MATVWFLMALIAFPGVPALNYKGYFAYFTKEECEMQRIPLENFIADVETKRGQHVFYIETYCLEMDAFQNQLDNYKKNKQKGIGLGGQQLGV
jgi:hypothetical protein